MVAGLKTARAAMPQIRYLTADEVVDVNKSVLKEIRVKKADAHRVASRQKIEDAMGKVQAEEGDAYRKAAVLLIQLTKAHAFEAETGGRLTPPPNCFSKQTERPSTSKSNRGF